MKLDYSLKTVEERIDYVNSILTPDVDRQSLSFMSDYILFIADKGRTKKEKMMEHSIITKNREVTINKRQVSLEEVVSNLENGEDGLYALIKNDKNQIMDPKSPISEKDMSEIPGLRENFLAIESLKRQFDKAEGKDRFSLKQQIIAKYQEQYILKASFKGIPAKGKPSAQLQAFAHMPLDENVTIDPDTLLPRSDCVISLFNPAHISFLLCYYSQLKEGCAEDLQSDMHYLLLDLENLVDKTLLPDYRVLYDLLVWKVDGRSNEEIQDLMHWRYNINHNEQYFSTLWRKRIPRLLAEQAQKDYLTWHYTNVEYGDWKRCGRCGEVKLAHPLFFSKNTSKDGLYSICKDCRSKGGR